jgi:hypothetical protein
LLILLAKGDSKDQSVIATKELSPGFQSPLEAEFEFLLSPGDHDTSLADFQWPVGFIVPFSSQFHDPGEWASWPLAGSANQQQALD